jgi:hypothetical protein
MTRTEPIDNSAEYIDSRDVIVRIDYLSTDEDTLDEDEREELTALRALADEGAQYAGDWEYGETLIRDSAFRDYAEQLADEIGAVSADATWPTSYIDWDAAADALRQDYTEVDFGGVAYLVRS